MEYSDWKRLPHEVHSISVNNDEELVLKFDFCFHENMKSVQFAFTYPYSHVDCRKDMLEI